jgi:hypothetical protein
MRDVALRLSPLPALLLALVVTSSAVATTAPTVLRAHLPVV